MQSPKVVRTKVFVHITQTWTPRAFFAAYEYAEKKDKKHLWVFDNGWKFVREVLHRVKTGERTRRIKTTGIDIDGKFIPKNECKKTETIQKLYQMCSFCEHDTMHMDDENPPPFYVESFWYYMNDGVSQLSIEKMREHFLNLKYYPNTTEAIIVDDCIIMSEVEDTELGKPDLSVFKANFWFVGEGDISQSLTEALHNTEYNLINLQLCAGYGFITIQSESFVKTEILLAFLNENMALFKIVKIVPL